MKNKTINLTEEQVQFLKEIKARNNWTTAFWFSSLQKQFEDIENAVIKNGSDFHGRGCYSTLDEAIESKSIRLI